MPEKIILLGAAGMLGRQLIASRPEDIELHGYTHRELNVCSRSELESAFQTVMPTTIINAAAYTRVDDAEQEQAMAFAVNAEAPGLIASLSPKSCRILHVSTDFVFDGKSRQPYKPSDQTAPLSVYGASKLSGEHNLLAQRPNSLILRTAWLYGSRGKNFVTRILELLRERPVLKVVDDQRGTPTSVNSLAEVIWRFVTRRELQGIYHWSDRGETSWYEFACEIQKQALALALLENIIPIEAIPTEAYPTPATRPAYSVLDKEETYQLIQYQGRAWQEELTDVLAEIKSY